MLNFIHSNWVRRRGAICLGFWAEGIFRSKVGIRNIHACRISGGSLVPFSMGRLLLALLVLVPEVSPQKHNGPGPCF